MTAPIKKPQHGAPCNCCGLCCQDQLCPLGGAIFGGNWDRPCPALERRGGGSGFVCGPIVNPLQYASSQASRDQAALSAAAAVLIGADWACDAQVEGERRALGWDKRLRRRRREISHMVNPALDAWGIAPVWMGVRP
jgi:hypothetical protein